MILKLRGSKQPDMPASASLKMVLPVKVLAQQILSLQRAGLVDTDFLKDVLLEENCPEYNAYNTPAARKQV